MLFSSIIFLVFFLPALIVIYTIVPKKWKNTILLLFSIVFYSWGAPKFIFVILGTTFIDFYLVRWMDRIDKRSTRRMLLFLSVSINLGLLLYFKYSNFFVENLNVVLGHFFHFKITGFAKLILPLGISFYTFETITYVVDVYRKVHKPLDNVWDYQLYILLFPKLIAGPIVRYHEIADQITDRSANDTIDDKLTGFYRFVIGLSKKVLIANQLGLQADAIFSSNYHMLNSCTAWVGALAYTFQIYFDFSGYSDMAIGLGRILGFKFPENFNNPYISQSITEFWRRWHMSLGRWMKNYLYIPLGGNRVNSKWRLYFNLWVVFLLSGLWHGASWSFVFWGAYHGAFLVMERGFLIRAFERTGKLFRTLFTFLIVLIGWVFFRVDRISDAFTYLHKMFAFNFSADAINPDKEFYFFFCVAVLFSFFVYFNRLQKIQDALYAFQRSVKSHVILTIFSILLLIFSISYITASGFNPFIYFRF
jgi:alginate O-acetyltransferase complex protein AlgI